MRVPFTHALTSPYRFGYAIFEPQAGRRGSCGGEGDGRVWRGAKSTVGARLEVLIQSLCCAQLEAVRPAWEEEEGRVRGESRGRLLGGRCALREERAESASGLL